MVIFRPGSWEGWTFTSYGHLGILGALLAEAKGLDMGKGEMRRTRGKESWIQGRQLENRSEGVTRRVSLVCSCWRLSNCLLALTKESYNEAMFDSEPFFFFWRSLLTNPNNTAFWALKTFPVSFLKHLSNEQFCSSQMLSKWPLKAQLNLGKFMPSRKTGMRISISREGYRKMQEFFQAEEQMWT